MKRIITMIILTILCYVLQVSVFSFFKLAGIAPNIMLILAVSFALMRGQQEGMILGFACGLLIDILSGNLLGFYAFLFLLMGYVNGLLNRIFYANNILLPLGMIFVNSIGLNVIVYVCTFLLRNRTDFGFYFMHVIAPETVYTFLVAIFLYNAFLGINKLLEKDEKRRSAA